MSAESTPERAVRQWLDDHEVAPDQQVHLAVSGGLDSMALLHAANAVHGPLHVLHVDHGLRPESDADHVFVEQVAKALGLPFTGHRIEGLRQTAADRGQGLEAASRAGRYQWMSEQVGPDGILLTAHHADDQRETRLLHWLRGSRMDAWAGMASWSAERGHALGRPFLGLSRDVLLQWMKSQRHAWREDPSNADPAHLRNRVRHELLPLLDDLRLGWESGLVRNATLASEWSAATDARLDALAGPPNKLPLDAVHQAPSPRWMLARWASNWSWPPARLEELVHLSQPDTKVGKEARHGACRVVRERHALVCISEPADFAASWSWHPEEGAGAIHTPLGTLAWSVEEGTDTLDPRDRTAQLDLDALRLPLTLRPWMPGDRLEPLGMTGSQSVSDILTQRGVDHALRKQALLLTQSDGRAAWLVGHRIDRRAALPNTGSAIRTLSLTWTPA